MRIARVFLSASVFGAVVSADASETVAYTYDALGRLTSASRTGAVNNGVQATYALDAAGNRTNVTVVSPGHLRAQELETHQEAPPAEKPSADEN